MSIIFSEPLDILAPHVFDFFVNQMLPSPSKSPLINDVFCIGSNLLNHSLTFITSDLLLVIPTSFFKN